MTNGIDESKKEIKKSMKKMKEESSDQSEKVKDKLNTAKEQTQDKLTDVKEQTQDKLEDVTEDTQERMGNIKDNLGDVKDEASTRLEQYRSESEKEGRNPAEKLLSDIITGLRQKTENVNQAMGERTRTTQTIPLTDVLETDTSITLITDIPGLSKEDIEIGIDQNSVEITATYKEKPPLTNAEFIQKERGYGTLHRTIDLPTPIDIKKTSAAYENCTLTITLPKKEKKLTKLNIQ